MTSMPRPSGGDVLAYATPGATANVGTAAGERRRLVVGLGAMQAVSAWMLIALLVSWADGWLGWWIALAPAGSLTLAVVRRAWYRAGSKRLALAGSRGNVAARRLYAVGQIVDFGVPALMWVALPLFFVVALVVGISNHGIGGLFCGC